MTQDNKNQNGIGRQLKKEREYRGFSKQEISDHLGIPTEEIEDIENDKEEIEPDVLESLTNLYNISLDELLKSGNNEHIDDDLVVHTRNVGDISDHDKEEIRRFVKYMRLRGGSEGTNE